MTLDSNTLFAANAVILAVFALAFLTAWRGEPGTRYLRSWFHANAVIALSLFCFMADELLPAPADLVIPNALLIIGFGLRWQAAREFTEKSAHPAMVYGPGLLMIPFMVVVHTTGSHATTFTAVNLVLCLQTLAVTGEFLRYRNEGTRSGLPLAATYLVMTASFGFRAGQGIFAPDQIVNILPDDMVLLVHLLVALFFTTASGAFALTIAYEKGASALRNAALRDPLTGLFNRRAFEAATARYLNERRGEEFAIVQFDIDHFKTVNDSYGHAAGDKALRVCARLFVGAMRPDDIIARVGGEEFAALLPGSTAAAACEIAERLRVAVRDQDIVFGRHSFSVTLSAGISHSRSDRVSFDDLMRSADECLYRAKRSGRDRVEHRAAA